MTFLWKHSHIQLKLNVGLFWRNHFFIWRVSHLTIWSQSLRQFFQRQTNVAPTTTFYRAIFKRKSNLDFFIKIEESLREIDIRPFQTDSLSFPVLLETYLAHNDSIFSPYFPCVYHANSPKNLLNIELVSAVMYIPLYIPANNRQNSFLVIIIEPSHGHTFSSCATHIFIHKHSVP